MARRHHYPQSWSTLIARAGGVLALAAKLGVKQPTLHRWAHDAVIPNEQNLAHLRDLAASYDLPSPL